MRLPSLSDLDREQRRIYGEAPGDGSILVVGPPGTGKTVMAFHRAHKLAVLGQKPRVIMFNRVLHRYTSTRGDVAPTVPVSTMHKWLAHWWRTARQGRVPHQADNTYLPNWSTIAAKAITSLHEGDTSLNWGHLLIDEGQDFPPPMYIALGLIQGGLLEKGIPTQITVFADDNQRLNAHGNSRVADIRNSLFINGDATRNYVLKKNFRNTKPIAAFAAHYQVSNESGIAELPESSGELPQVIFAANDRDISDFIARKAKISAGKQIGIIVQGTQKQVKRAYNQLNSRLSEDKPIHKLQMYISSDKNHTDEGLDFESISTITVLHMNSAKGLEFDLVFFVGMEKLAIESSGFYNERMALYVMCSRARSELFVVFNDVDPDAPLPPAHKLLPRPSKALCRYIALGSLATHGDKFIGFLESNVDFEGEAHDQQ